jgi:Zn ribbon nucleic-acid-binding protein
MLKKNRNTYRKKNCKYVQLIELLSMMQAWSENETDVLHLVACGLACQQLNTDEFAAVLQLRNKSFIQIQMIQYPELSILN